MFNYLQKKGLLFAMVCLGLSPMVASAQQCDGQEGALPDTPVEVGGDGSVATNPEVTCFYFRFDSDITGFPTGITMDLWHEYEGDLGIFIEACGERLNVLQRPGAVGNCSADCAFNIPGGDCGSSAMIGDENNPEVINFFETGTEPDNGISMGGSFGLTLDDACGVSTLGVNSFAELWSNCPDGLVEAEICFSDHASLHMGYVSNLNFIFPNPYECGCMDEDALNYNENANVSSGSGDCIYECLDRIVEIESQPAIPVLCQGADTVILTAITDPAPNDATYQWIGSGFGNDYLSDPESASTEVYIPADFVGSIVYTVTVTDELDCIYQESVTITVNPSATAEIIGQDFVCGNDSTDLVLQGGPFDQIIWSTGDTDTDTIRVGAGTYEVTVSNPGLCEAVAVFTVTAFPEPEPLIAGPDTICFNDTVWLEVDSIFSSYSWSNGDTLSAIFVNESGLYTVAVVDSNGCSGLDTFQLSHYDTLQLAITGLAAFCPGDSVSLSAPIGLESYQWSTGDTTQQIFVSTPGLVSLTAIDGNGCSATASQLVEELNAPQPQIIGPPALCPDETVQLSVIDSYADYLWSNSDEDSSIMVDQTGTYAVTVTDTLGCTGNATFELIAAPPVTVSLGYPEQICAEDNATIIADPNLGTYNWSTGDSTSTITVSGPGTYELELTSPEGCTITASAVIDSFLTTPPVIDGPDGICIGDATTLTASPGYDSYEWQDGTLGNTFVANNEGLFTVEVVDSNGCSLEATYALSNYPEPTVEITGTTQICEDGSGLLQATTGFASYSWSVVGEEGEDLTITEPGTYSLTVVDENNCEATAEETVSLSIPLPEIEGIAAFCAGGSTQLSVVDTFDVYQWSGGTLINDTTIMVDAEGSYSLTVTDAAGCEASTDVMIVENELPTPTITGELDFCAGSSTVLSAEVGFQMYNWSVAGNTDADLEVFDADTYTVTVTDVNGCEGVATTATTVNPLPTPEIIGELNFCPGDNTTLFSAENYQSYVWSTGSDIDSTLVDADDVVSLTVTDTNGCEGTTTAQPAEYAVDTPEITGELEFCLDGSTTLSAPAGYVNYLWSGGQTGQQATFSAPGTVVLQVVDTNGCESENDVDLNLFEETELTLIGEPDFCVGESTEITASGNFVSYLWSNDESSVTITVAEEGTFDVTATDANGCATTASTEVSVNALPEPEITGLLTFCEGFTTTLATNQSYESYSWSDNSTDPSLEVATAGTISVTVTDANGCIGTDLVSLTTVTELDPTIEGLDGFCPGESVILYVEEGFESPTWSTGVVADSIIVNTPGQYTVDVSAPGGCTGSATIDVTEYVQPSVEIQAPDGLCTDDSALLTTLGSAGDLEWNDGSTSSELFIQQSGQFSVLLTDNNGCTAVDTASVLDWGQPNFEVVGPENFCEGDDAELEVVPAFMSYQWSNGSTDSITTISEGSTVTVTVTDDNGCTATEATALVEIPLPEADAGFTEPLDCDTEFVTLGGSESSTGQEFIYQWSGPGIDASNEDDPFPLVDAAGEYILIITNDDFDCVSEADTVVVEDLSYVPEVVVGVGDTLDCVTFSVTLDGTGSTSGPNISYQWLDANGLEIPGATSLQFEVDVAGDYSLMVVDSATACTADELATVVVDREIPTIESLTGGDLDCEDTETIVSVSMAPTSDFVYSWMSGAGGSIISATNETSITVDAPAWYFLEVLDMGNGCVSVDSAFVDQDITPPVVATNEDQTLFCNDENVSLSGQGSTTTNASYQWYFDSEILPGATSILLTTVNPGLYTLVVTDLDNGCTASSDVSVSLDPTAPEEFALSYDPPTCQGDADGSLWVSDVEGGISPYMYSFEGQPFSALSNFQGLTAGTYEVVLEDANGCQLTALVDLPDGNNVTLELGPDQRIKEGELIDIFPQVSIDSMLIAELDWQTTVALPCPDCLVQQDLFLTQSTRFFLTITDENGCPAEDNVLIIVERDQNIYVPNGFSPNNDGRNDRFYIFSDNDSVEEIELLRIFNRWGEFVWENSNFQPDDPTAGWDGTVGGMDPNPAVYVWYAEVKMRNGEKLLLKGDVTLVE